eukprot:TRINITY_DN555_c0_g1_i3.p1 TRINITY_DN555_c0_g1~~TRINITY_DN555_c0_g1_i3.p1  ORF type:complete len:268 (-),score=31.55 TRINITY_DN555_c0_g1_i3:247-1002(-)
MDPKQRPRDAPSRDRSGVISPTKQLRTLLMLVAYLPAGLLILFDQLFPVAHRQDTPMAYRDIRVFDMLDPVFVTPFMAIAFKVVDGLVFAERPLSRRNTILQWAAYLTFVMFVYGAAIHFAANAIHVFCTEVHHYRLPDDLYGLIYFLDEDLGHWLTFASLFCTLAVYVMACKQPARRDDWPLIAAATFMGLTWSIGVIESSHAWMGFVFSLLLLTALGISMNVFNNPVTPLGTFAATLAVVCVQISNLTA